MLGDEFAIGDFIHVTHAVAEDDFLETLVGFGILDDTHERRKAGTGAQQVQMLARLEIVQHQRTRRLLADDDLVTFLEVLQLGSQRAVRHLDAEEFQMLFPVRAGNRISTHERTTVWLLQTDHHELTVLETQTRVAGALETEEGIVPVVDAEDTLVVHVAHVREDS